MLYVAGEIIIWMVLAFALGLLIGWFVWGLRQRKTRADAAAAPRPAPASDIESVRPVPKAAPVVAEGAVEELPVTPPAGQPAVPLAPPVPVSTDPVGASELSFDESALEESAFEEPAAPVDSGAAAEAGEAVTAGAGHAEAATPGLAELVQDALNAPPAPGASDLPDDLVLPGEVPPVGEPGPAIEEVPARGQPAVEGELPSPTPGDDQR
jgi:hypothetical protein